jgi:hypothetical protein
LLAEFGCARDALSSLDDEDVRAEVMNDIAAEHPLAQTLVRNRKAEIGGFTRREATRALVQLTNEELELYEDITEYLRTGYDRAIASKNLAVGFVMVTYQKMLASSSYAIRTSFGRRIKKLHKHLADARTTPSLPARRLTAEAIDTLHDVEEVSPEVDAVEDAAVDAELLEWEIATLERFVERLGRARDSKAEKLLDALAPIFDDNADEKAIVFTQFIETQQFLKFALEANGYRVSVFNGRMSLDEKEDAVRGFRQSGEILISTEAGGEGRNFQFCHYLFNYDLPWNPMRVEQRIGRLDRIGQRYPILIVNLACEDTVEERVLDVLERRIGLFEESVGSLDPILGGVERDIEALVMSRLPDFAKSMDAFEEDVARRVREARERERTLADFALDRASFRRDVANELLERTPLAKFHDLERHVADVLEYGGGTVKPHADGGLVMSFAPTLRTQLGTRSATARGVFDPTDALRHEDLDFFAFGHPLVDAIVDLPVEFDNALTGIRSSHDAPPGTWVELWWEITSDAKPISGSIHRHLVGEDLQVVSSPVTSAPAAGVPVYDADVPAWAADAVTASRRVFDTEFRATRHDHRERVEASRSEELARAQRIFEYREVRLRVLIDNERAWIEEREVHGSERDKRVLPARRGKLAKDVERLDALEEEYRAQVDALRKREPATSARLLAAGVVIVR